MIDEIDRVGKLPPYVKLPWGVVLSLSGNVYYRQAGEWYLNVEVKGDKIIAGKCGPEYDRGCYEHLVGIELTPANIEEYVESNRR